MARDSEREPVTDDDLRALRECMADQREAIRARLAEELDGSPEDFSAERYFQARTDGGEGHDREETDSP